MRLDVQLRSLLAKRGVSVRTVAKQIGEPPATVARWFSGESEPKFSEAIKIAAYFGTTLDGLVSGVAETHLSPPPVELTNADRTILLAVRELGLSFEGALQRLSGPITYAEGKPRQAKRNNDEGAA